MRSHSSPTFSFVIPTRGRPAQAGRLLDSLAETTTNLQNLEVIFVVDSDDPDSQALCHASIQVTHVIGPPGQRMGALNMAGYEASRGRYFMLLNDDVVSSTTGWDEIVLASLLGYPDDIVLIHVNDLIFRDSLCTFPLVSRTWCELAGGICPREYRRYRIDDHIEDVFNLLAELDERRIIYLPDVVFEHHNYAERGNGERFYTSDPDILALDAPLFERLLPQRKQLALKLKQLIERQAQAARAKTWEQRLEPVTDSIALRVPGRARFHSAKFPPSSTDTRVTVGLLTSDSLSAQCRRCLSAVERHSQNYELVLLERRNEEFQPPRELNRLLATAASEYVVLLTDDVIPLPGWLDGLLRGIQPNVGAVIPLRQTCNQRSCHSGLWFSPDDSGHHGPILGKPAASGPILSFCNSPVLLDGAKCRHVLFDEGYSRFFFDIDLGLRVWEHGLQVVCTPEAVVTQQHGELLTGNNVATQAAFERDRLAFVSRWIATGRLQRLRSGIWPGVPELMQLFDLESQALGLLDLDPGEPIESFQERAEDILHSIEACPILKLALFEAATRLLRESSDLREDPALAHLAWLVRRGQPGLVQWSWEMLSRGWTVLQRGRSCFRHRGMLGLLRAVWNKGSQWVRGQPLSLDNRTGRNFTREALLLSAWFQPTTRRGAGPGAGSRGRVTEGIFKVPLSKSRSSL
jgi:GT2 family glycosyltransferase